MYPAAGKLVWHDLHEGVYGGPNSRKRKCFREVQASIALANFKAQKIID
jgi:hypothetical protein